MAMKTESATRRKSYVAANVDIFTETSPWLPRITNFWAILELPYRRLIYLTSYRCNSSVDWFYRCQKGNVMKDLRRRHATRGVTLTNSAAPERVRSSLGRTWSGRPLFCFALPGKSRV